MLLEEITRIKNIKIDDIDESVEELPSDTKED